MDSQSGSTEFSGQFPKHFRKASTFTIKIYNGKYPKRAEY